MLREDGFVLDDGTVERGSAEQHFIDDHDGNAVTVMQHLRVLPPGAVAGARRGDHIGDRAVGAVRGRGPALARRAGEARCARKRRRQRRSAVHGSARRHDRRCAGAALRVSFSGELAYEVAVPAAYGDALFRALIEAGAEFGIAPYGTEALNVLRIEKGHRAGRRSTGARLRAILASASWCPRRRTASAGC